MIDNIFSSLPEQASAEEQFLTLLNTQGLRIERIVSSGQASPPGFWYEQDEAEWVLVLAGAARLRFADETFDRLLERGDFIHIACKRRHRVEWSDPAQNTVWLAIHYLQPGDRKS